MSCYMLTQFFNTYIKFSKSAGSIGETPVLGIRMVAEHLHLNHPFTMSEIHLENFTTMHHLSHLEQFKGGSSPLIEWWICGDRANKKQLQSPASRVGSLAFLGASAQWHVGVLQASDIKWWNPTTSKVQQFRILNNIYQVLIAHGFNGFSAPYLYELGRERFNGFCSSYETTKTQRRNWSDSVCHDFCANVAF